MGWGEGGMGVVSPGWLMNGWGHDLLAKVCWAAGVGAGVGACLRAGTAGAWLSQRRPRVIGLRRQGGSFVS